MSARGTLARILCTVAAFALAPAARAACADDPHYRQMDFLVGSWDVSSHGEKTAEVTWSRELDGCGLHEVWKAAPGRSGMGMMSYAPLRDSLTYYWVSETGANNVYSQAEARPNDLTFLIETRHPSGTGKRARRFRLALQQDGTVLEDSRFSDNGAPYQPEFQLVWTRKQETTTHD
ncbi:hypothetical protein [Novosphingobium sp. 9U]|uniref:hypothetical protein n=1 Tax=Novosphingobium sp. 9U TaxID=2653158 RepID=UPI0012F2285F|nr:hypothetical protein [Novosphingobium sp. 9U]VWX53995.1 conserved exported hypothetical protein [Novosphingobium sp. 9U]